MATANILSIKNQGLVAYDGSATFNGRTLSATSSKISISNGNGVSGNPSVDVVEANLTLNNIGGTLGVSKGGTGANTLTNNSLLLGNGTSAVSGLGAATNGQIPIGSTGNAPVLATITAGSGVTITNGAGSIQIDSVGSAANANAILDEQEDFIYFPTTGFSSTVFSLFNGFYLGGSGTDAGSIDPANFTSSARPGVLALGLGTDIAGQFLLAKGVGNAGAYRPSFIVGGGAITLQWFIKLHQLSNGTDRYTLRVGFMDKASPGSANPNNGIYFSYSDNANSGNWQINTIKPVSSITTNNTSTAASTNWTVLKIIINAAGTSVAFYVDGTEVANSPIATNIPALGIVPQLECVGVAGTSANRQLGVDLYTLQQVLTTAR